MYQFIWHTISCAVPDSSVSGTSEEAIFQPYYGLCNFLNVLTPLHCHCCFCWSSHDWYLQNARIPCCNWAELSPVASSGLSSRCQDSTSLHNPFNPGASTATAPLPLLASTVRIPSSMTPSSLQSQCLLVTALPSSAASIGHILGHL